MNILGVIPARGGSKGVPKKNIIDVGGKPLLAYTAEAALSATKLTRVILSTDSEEIAAVGKQCGLEVPFLRPAELAEDNTPTIVVLQHLLDALAQQGQYYDALCLLQPTSPFRDSEMVDEACSQYIAQQADSLLSVLMIPHQYHPDWALVSDDNRISWANGQQDPPARRQELRPAYHREGSIYIAKTELITQHGTLYGKKIIPYVVDPDLSVNIVTVDDLNLAREKIKGKN